MHAPTRHAHSTLDASGKGPDAAAAAAAAGGGDSDAQLQQVWEGGALDVSALAAALGAPAVTTEAEAAAFLYSDEVQQLLTDHLLPQT